MLTSVGMRYPHSVTTSEHCSCASCGDSWRLAQPCKMWHSLYLTLVEHHDRSHVSSMFQCVERTLRLLVRCGGSIHQPKSAALDAVQPLSVSGSTGHPGEGYIFQVGPNLCLVQQQSPLPVEEAGNPFQSRDPFLAMALTWLSNLSP